MEHKFNQETELRATVTFKRNLPESQKVQSLFSMANMMCNGKQLPISELKSLKYSSTKGTIIFNSPQYWFSNQEA